jgi:hypothetical protein
MHFVELKPNSAAVKARECMRRIRKEKDLGIQYEKSMYSGRLVYYTKKAQLRHKRLVADFYLRLLRGPGRVLEFETEYTLGGSCRADAFAAYEVKERVRLFCLEVHISNNKLDLSKYEKACLSPEWIYPAMPTIVIVSNWNHKLKKLQGGLKAMRLGIDYEGWEKALELK